MLKGVVGCGWVRCLGCGFASVGLNGFAPVFFFLNGFAPVGFKLAAWVSDWWLCWFDGLIGWVLDRRGFVFVFVFVFVVCARG